MKQYKLFIDESGHPHRNHASSHFTLVGIIIADGSQQELKIKADQIRFKYWDKTNVVFHSEEIGRRVGDYALFGSKPDLAKKFEKQLFQFLGTAPIYIVASVVDKNHAYKIGWKEETIISRASESLVLDFLAFLYGQGATGKVVYETSGSTRDSLYLKAFHRYLDPNWESKYPDYANVREHLTSITFASKLNHDTEMQLADLFSYAAVCTYRTKNKIAKYGQDSYEQKLINTLQKKLLKTPAGIINKSKQKYYSQINGFSSYPVKKAKKKRTA